MTSYIYIYILSFNVVDLDERMDHVVIFRLCVFQTVR